MPHTHHAGFELWEVGINLTLVFTALFYVCGWVQVRRLNRDSVKGWHVASFLSGLFFIWLAMASPIAVLDHRLLTVHMIHHLLLMTLAPPLIWLGAPKPMLRGFPPLAKMSGEFLRWTPVKRLETTIAHPAVCWLAAATTLIAWHIPSLFAFGMRSETWHEIEQASFLLTGLLFWWPVMRPQPSVSNWSGWTTLLYLFLATLPCDILSGFLVFCDRVVYPVYSSSPQRFGLSALEDQQCAGALMWTCVTVVYLIAGTILAARLLSPRRVRHSQAANASTASSKAGTRGRKLETPWHFANH
jgi:cytochrome c oxidase assembly factor CtaG